MKIKSSSSDLLGIVSAILCLLHCLAAPILLGLYSHSHDHIHHNDFFLLHHGWDYVFLGLGLIAVLFSAKHSKSNLLKALLGLTYAFLVASILLEEVSELFKNLVYVSSISLILIHSLNIRHWIKHAKRTHQMSPSK